MVILIRNSGMEIWSPAETAKAIGVSVRTLARMRENGTGPMFRRISARKIQYMAKDVKQWLAERCGQ